MPPPRKTRMTDLARAARLAVSAALSFSNARRLDNERPKGASAPTRKKSRRETPLQRRLRFGVNETSNIVGQFLRGSPLMIKCKFLRVKQGPEQIAIDLIALFRAC